MAGSNFTKSLDRLLVTEGGRANHPKDPGGRTFQGVTQRIYDGYRRRKGQTSRDVWDMSPSERDDIYRAQYWNEIKADDLPVGVDYVVFDGAVNSGPSQAVKWMQRALAPHYTGRIDGHVGQATLAALDQHPDHDLLIAEIAERRMLYLKQLKTWPVFGRGWSTRVRNVTEAGQAWAAGSVGPAPVAAGSAKAPIEHAKPMPGTGVADAATGGGVLATTITQATDQLTPLADQVPAVATIVAVLTAAGVVIFVGGLAWRWWAQRRQIARDDALDLGGAAT